MMPSTGLAKFRFLCQTRCGRFLYSHFLTPYSSMLFLSRAFPSLFFCLLAAFFSCAADEAAAQSGAGDRRPAVELAALTSSTSESGTPKLLLRSFTVETLNDGVHVSTGLGMEQEGVVRSQLRDGAVMTLQCKLTLVRVRTILANQLLAEEARSYQLRYDLLTREFILSSPGLPIVRQKQFGALVASAWRNLEFVLPLKTPLESGQTYRVLLQVTLEHAEVPPWLEKALFFWSWEVTPPLAFSQEFIF